MDWKYELKPFSIILFVFLLFYFLPLGTIRFERSILEALHLVKWYAQEHVILCLVPAFFIAGAISVFISQGAVIKYFGITARKTIAYPVAAVSGSILAVCSCTVLPLFAGIHKRGAGLGPAIAFLYSGPAINVLAIILTARVLGVEMGIARSIGAILFSVVIGLLMAFIFRKEEKEKRKKSEQLTHESFSHPIPHIVVYFFLMIFILMFANWGKPQEIEGFWFRVYSSKWLITSLSAILFAFVLVWWFKFSRIKIAIITVITAMLATVFWSKPIIPFSAGFIGLAFAASTGNDENREWIGSTWGYTKQIMPLLFMGIVIAGFLLGRPGAEGMIPSTWIGSLVGGNSVLSNLFASIVGAFMYFATLTEIPILDGLIANGMGNGPALALLLAGPAVSLPNMFVIRSVIGTKKTVIFVLLVIIMATISGVIYGKLF
jgi:uncharacterized membrane protein YraQ (UPF0718 family)